MAARGGGDEIVEGEKPGLQVQTAEHASGVDWAHLPRSDRNKSVLRVQVLGGKVRAVADGRKIRLLGFHSVSNKVWTRELGRGLKHEVAGP